MFDLLWPVVIVVFVGFVFFLVTRLIGLALSECDAEWSSKGLPRTSCLRRRARRHQACPHYIFAGPLAIALAQGKPDEAGH